MHRKEILETAIKYVCQDRNATHGEPEEGFARVAEYWTTYLKSKTPGSPITSTDVALLMTLFKFARIEANPANTDSWIDGAGYLACGGGIATAMTKPGSAQRDLMAKQEPAKFKPQGIGEIAKACAAEGY